MKIISTFLFIVFLLPNTHSQTIADIIFPDKKFTKQAKQKVKESLKSIKDSLDISVSDTWLGKFELYSCDEASTYMAEHGFFADSDKFLKNNNCKWIYAHSHIISKMYLKYNITHYFDEHGTIIKREISRAIITH